jgi:hypothetical protein
MAKVKDSVVGAHEDISEYPAISKQDNMISKNKKEMQHKVAVWMIMPPTRAGHEGVERRTP